MSSYAATMIARAEEALADGRKEDAYSIVKPIVDAEPTNAEAWRVLANATSDPQEAAIARAREAQALPLQAPQPTPRPVVAAAPVASQPQSSRRQLQGGLIAGGAVLMGIGAMLPWGTVRAGLLERTVNGMDGDGIIVLFLAGVLLVAGIGVLINGSRFARVMAILSILAGAGVAAYDMVNVLTESSRQNKLAAVEAALGGTSSGPQVSMSLGAGLFVVLFAAFIAFVGVALPDN